MRSRNKEYWAQIALASHGKTYCLLDGTHKEKAVDAHAGTADNKNYE